VFDNKWGTSAPQDIVVDHVHCVIYVIDNELSEIKTLTHPAWRRATESSHANVKRVIDKQNPPRLDVARFRYQKVSALMSPPGGGLSAHYMGGFAVSPDGLFSYAPVLGGIFRYARSKTIQPEFFPLPHTIKVMTMRCVDGHFAIVAATMPGNTLCVLDPSSFVPGPLPLLAGNGASFYHIPLDGTGSTASFVNIEAVCCDPRGNVFVADDQGCIRHVAPDGTVTTIAGHNRVRRSTCVDGVGDAACLERVTALCVDDVGTTVYAAGSSSIRAITRYSPPLDEVLAYLPVELRGLVVAYLPLVGRVDTMCMRPDQPHKGFHRVPTGIACVKARIINDTPPPLTAIPPFWSVLPPAATLEFADATLLVTGLEPNAITLVPVFIDGRRMRW